MKTIVAYKPVELLVDETSNERITYITYVEQFYILAGKIKKKGLSLKKLAKITRIEFDRLVGFFKDKNNMKPQEQFAIQKALR